MPPWRPLLLKSGGTNSGRRSISTPCLEDFRPKYADFRPPLCDHSLFPSVSIRAIRGWLPFAEHRAEFLSQSHRARTFLGRVCALAKPGALCFACAVATLAKTRRSRAPACRCLDRMVELPWNMGVRLPSGRWTRPFAPKPTRYDGTPIRPRYP